MKARVAMLAVMVALTTTPPANGGNAIQGFGVTTCGAFAGLYRSDPDPMEVEGNYFNWAQGFMSGLNLRSLMKDGTSKDLFSPPTDQQKQRIRAYCNDHPSAPYFDAILGLHMNLRPNPQMPPLR